MMLMFEPFYVCLFDNHVLKHEMDKRKNDLIELYTLEKRFE